MRLVFDKSTEVEMMLLKFIFATFHACIILLFSDRACMIGNIFNNLEGFKKKKKGNNS